MATLHIVQRGVRLRHMRQTVKVLEAGISERMHAGAQICVAHNGKVVFDEAIGDARPGVEMLPKTPTLWMSAAKPITAVAILQLIEEGRLELATRVADVLPEFANGGKESVTVEHCLLHTGGFRGPFSSFAHLTFEESVRAVCELRQEPNWVAGNRAGYHAATSWIVLGQILQAIDRKLFETSVRERVFSRVSMNNSFIGLRDDFGETGHVERVLGDVAWTYDTRQPSPVRHAAFDRPQNLIVPRPGVNTLSTAGDMVRFYTSLLENDNRLLRAATVVRMTSGVRAGMFDETFKTIVDWGLGLKLDSKMHGPGETYGYGRHASASAFGHSGNQCSCAFADPKHNLVVAWVVTGLPGEPAHQVRQESVNAAIYEDLELVIRAG